MPSCYLKTDSRAWYIPPCVWIMTVGFTGRCHRDEECHALAHETKRCMMGSGSYDNNHKLGLTGRHDDGPALKLRHATRPQRRPPVWALTPEAFQQYGVCQVHSWTTRHASCERIVSTEKKKKNEQRGGVLVGVVGGGVGGRLRQIHTVIQMVRTLRPWHKQDHHPNTYSH